MSARLGGVDLDHLVTVFSGQLVLEVDEDPKEKFQAVVFRLDAGPWEALDEFEMHWRAEISGESLSPGFHVIEVMVVAADGQSHTAASTFRVRA